MLVKLIFGGLNVQKCFVHVFELSIGIRAGTLVEVLLPKCDPRPLCCVCCFGFYHAEL